jgi:hypothetical protein
MSHDVSVDAHDEAAIFYSENGASPREPEGPWGGVLPMAAAVLTVALLWEHMSAGVVVALWIGVLLAVRRNRRYFARR